MRRNTGDRIRNQCIHKKLGIALMENLMRESIEIFWTCATNCATKAK